jgi:hypothetical protein
MSRLENETFSYDLLRKLSRNFIRPVIFRGLAKDLDVMKKWDTPNFFINTPKYADTEILVVQNALVKQQQYVVPPLDQLVQHAT